VGHHAPTLSVFLRVRSIRAGDIMTRLLRALSLGIWAGALLFMVAASFGETQDRKVVLMSVSGTIDLGLAPYTSRMIRQAEEMGAAALILHINTPGGRVDAAIQMRDALLDARLDTIAFIDKEAYSAGALIALAAKQIYMTGGAVIGAATPVDQSGQKVSEKHVSAIRKLFRATAEQNGRPPEVAEAMVDEDVAIPGLIDKGKLLTLTTQEALQWKVADGRFDTLDAVLAHLHLSSAQLIRLQPNWAESLVRAITHPMVASLLLSVGMLGLLAELLSPGFGIPGGLGITSLALFFGGHYLVGLAGWEEALLIGTGVILLGAELLIIPGFGVTGILGLLTLGAGVFLSFLGSYPSAGDIWTAATGVLMSVGIIAVGAGVMIALLPGLPMWSRLNLRARLEPAPEPTVPPEGRMVSPWLGAQGVTLTPLRPAGTGLFRGDRLDIMSEGEYVPAATTVTIVRVEGNRIVVRTTTQPQS
jgi:membrane-bound serine protease (ClpP class)